MPLSLPPQVEWILSGLAARGYEGYAVGGCVRDLLAGREPHDWDICTNALPEESKRCFPGYATVDTGAKHGTVTLLLDGVPYEITTYRTDGGYADHRHPSTVTFVGSLRDDLARRDFTINAMAFRPAAGLIDPFGGQADMLARKIRCVGDPALRFGEDALRIMRGIRFASVLDCEVEAETARQIHALRAELQAISAERIAAELDKLLCGKNVWKTLLAYADVLCTVIPELTPCIGFDQRNPHHDLTVWEHIAKSVHYAPADRVLRLTMLLHDIGKPACFIEDPDGVGHFYGHQQAGAEMADAILLRLRCDNATRERVVTLVRYHDICIDPTGKSVRRVLSRLGPETVRQILDIQCADAKARANPEVKLREIAAIREVLQSALAANACFSLRSLAVGGKDILSLGAAQGPDVGAVLQTLLSEVVDGALANDRAALLARARALIPKSCPNPPSTVCMPK